ncbi:MAG: outer membrane beta-barrel protein [Verrucomicrobia bacterium]|nr:outer membrane beta-barrel protein [Verrucomicrobiota bacterium]MCH8513618.1 outer membrane beta-barrel protein [Kiritimatiellia bacterium]
MTKTTQLFCTVLFAATFARVSAQPFVDQTPFNQNVRLGAVLELEGDASGDEVWGFEVGYAQRIYPIDQMVFSFGHVASSDLEQNYFLVSFEQQFPINSKIAPYGTSGIGYIWNDDKIGDANREALYGKVGAGVIFLVAPRWSVVAELNYRFARDSVWLDEDGFHNTNWQTVLGLRYSF